MENVYGGGGGDFIEDGSSKSASPVAMTPGDETDLFMGDKTPEAKPKAVPPPRPPPPVVKPPSPDSPEIMSSDTATIPVNINVAPLISPLNISVAPGVVPNVSPIQLIDGVQTAQTVQSESQFPGDCP